MKHPCKDCGKLIHPVSTRCNSCASKVKWANGSFAKVHHRKGAENPNWRGGKYKTQKGYIMTICHEHPRATSWGYVFEHILVWETLNQRPLPEGWIIHHLNGIKTDNRLINLQALPNHKHSLVLAAKAKRIQELEALLNHQTQLL